MGAWGNRSFDNDDAADWLLDLIDGSDLDLVRHTLSKAVDSGDYLEAPDASQAIAAAEVVAAALGRTTQAAQEEEGLADWLARTRPSVPTDLVPLAVRALDRILAPNSELRELWEESEEFADWQSEVDGLRSKLKI